MRKLSVTVALVLAVATVAYAGPKGKKYGEHTIHGMRYDKAAVEKLLDDSEVPAEVTADERGVQKLKGKFKLDRSMTVEDAAVDFIDRHRNAFKLKEPKKELKLEEKKIYKTGKGGGILYYDQTYNGLPVWGHLVSVIFTTDSDIDEIVGGNVPTPNIDTAPLLTADEALAIAKKDLGIPADAETWPPKMELFIFPINNREPKLAYKVEIEDWVYFINAKDGGIIDKFLNVKFDGPISGSNVRWARPAFP